MTERKILRLVDSYHRYLIRNGRPDDAETVARYLRSKRYRKLLRVIIPRDKRVIVPIKAKRKSKGRQYPVQAESFAQIAEALANFSDDVITPTLDNKALLAGISRIFNNEFLRVRKILR